jgi:3-methyladenine DNA glycosylase AlkC
MSEKRKGASRRSDVSADVLRQLNAGTLETATLSESLVIDFGKLLKAVVPGLSVASLKSVNPADGVTKRMAAAGRALATECGAESFDRFASHPSDTVRGWAAYQLAATNGLTQPQRLDRMRPLADDPHFGVREWAWIALRDAVAADVPAAIAHLTPWVRDASANIRRFASEITRPRGVWCAHLTQLKVEPELGLPLLDPLRSDESKYVRDSVANWLNDAGKSQPKWVQSVCKRWTKESQTKETQYVVARAMRNL